MTVSYRVSFKASAEKSMHGLPKAIQARLIGKATALGENPRPPGCVKLAGAPCGAYEAAPIKWSTTSMTFGNWWISASSPTAARYIGVFEKRFPASEPRHIEARRHVGTKGRTVARRRLMLLTPYSRLSRAMAHEKLQRSRPQPRHSLRAYPRVPSATADASSPAEPRDRSPSS